MLVINQVRPRAGLAWISAVSLALINWVGVVYLHFFPPAPFILPQWLPMVGTSGSLVFQLDGISWVYVFSLASLLVAVLFTAAVRLKHQSNPRSWAACLAIAGVGSLAAMSATPLTFVLTWMLVDIVELAAIVLGVGDANIKRQAVIGFSTRAAGSLLLMVAMFLSSAAGSALVLIAPVPQVGILLVFAVGLRLGVLPLHLPYAQDLPLRRGLGTILRMTAPLSSLVLLARLPNSFLPTDSANLLLALTGLTSVYSAGMWVFSDHEIKGRPYWLIALAGMGLAGVIRGYPNASVAWGMTAALAGGVIFLFSVRSRGLRVLPGLGLILLSGLPFTPAAIGWFGLVTTPINLADLLFIFTHFLLMVGYLRHSWRSEETDAGIERWAKVVYPVGLAILIVSASVIEASSGMFSAGVWWASLLSGLAAGVTFFLVRRLLLRIGNNLKEQWFYIFGQRVGRIFSAVLSFRWLFTAFGWVLGQVNRLTDTISTILEGDGGILWVFVLLALFISIAINNFAP